MQKFYRHVIFSVLMILSLSLPSWAAKNPKGSFEALSPEFLRWQAENYSQALSENSSPLGGYVPSPVNLSHLGSNLPIEGGSQSMNVKADALPSKYDLRSVNGKSYVTSIKNQNPYGTCWAHAAVGAMESNMLIQGKGTFDLSEMHLAWFTFRDSEKSKSFKNVHTSGFSSVMNMGGNSFYPAAVFSRLSGPANESDVPYGQDKQPSKSSAESYTRVLRLREVYYLSMGSEPNVNSSQEARDIVKRRIMNSGAVVGNYYSNNGSYYKSATAGTNYYYKSSSVNHAVQIIGWDDNYSRENFSSSSRPSSNGAWLIKNSWGNSWYTGSGYAGDEGCFWMSYEQYLTEGSAFIAEAADTKMKAYLYDPLGWCATWGYGYSGSHVHAANVFRAERDTETVTEVGFYTPDNNIEYEINLYSGMSSMPSSSPVPSGSKASSPAASGKIPYAGYHTITLATPLTVSKGEYFSVVVTFKNYGMTPVEMKISGWSDNALIESGSFFSYNGSSWVTGASKNMNATVRAFTVTGAVSGSAPRINEGSPSDATLNKSYTAQLSASGTQPITWSVSGGSLPAGLKLDASSGKISGTPTTEGKYTFGITAKNSYGSDTRNYTINVLALPEITTTGFSGYVGYSFTGTLELSPKTAAKWSVKSGRLPTGLSLNSSSGAITGKPSKAGTYSVTFLAASAAGNSEGTVKFTINAKPVKPTIKISSMKAGMVGTFYSQKVEVDGTMPITLTVEGHPNGLSLTRAAVNLSGTPAKAGTYTLKFTAENIATSLDGKPVVKTVKLTVKARPPVIATHAALADAILGEKYGDVKFSLSAGDQPVTWSASGVPSGLKMSTSGVLSGTPTRAGNFNMTIKAVNSSGNSTMRMPLTVLEKPSASTSRISAATTDKLYNAKISAKGTLPISWEISGLPDTMKLTKTQTGNQATITGTPVKAGDYPLTITMTNKAGKTKLSLTLTVKGVAPSLSATLARGTAGSKYSGSKIYALGTKPITITYSISDADKAKFGIRSLEDLGLSFKSDPKTGTAEITGTPDVSVKGLPIIFSAKNSVSSSPITKRATLNIAGEKPAFTKPAESTINITCEVSSYVEVEFEAQGTKNIAFTMSRASGFLLERTGENSARLYGTAPARDGTLTITVTASNADGKATRKVAIKTMTPPSITTASLNNGTLNRSYTAKVMAAGTKTIKWTLDGNLPSGLKFSNGSISGKPAKAGNFTFTLTASNSIGKDKKKFTIAIIDPAKTTAREDIPELPELPDVEEAPEPAPLPEPVPVPEHEPAPVPEPEVPVKTPEEVSDPVLEFGAERTEESLPAPVLEWIEREGYIIAAVLPEVSVNVSGFHSIKTGLYVDVPAGSRLFWLAFAEEGKESDDDEIAEFYDESGAEIVAVPENGKISVSAWLNKGVKYSPVIAVKGE